MHDCRDRTSDFFAAFNSPVSPMVCPSATVFSSLAETTGARLRDLSPQLDKFAKLSKRRNLFNDPHVEIDRTVTGIKTSLSQLNDNMAQMAIEVTNNAATHGIHARQSAGNTMTQLKLQLQNKTREFSSLLLARTKHLKENNEMRKQFETPRPRADADADTTGSSQFTTVPLCNEDSHTTVVQIENNIELVKNMYSHLSFAIEQQNDVVLRIDSNTDEALMHTERAHEELIKYHDRQGMGNGSCLLIKVFVTLIVMLSFFIVFVW